MMGKEDLIVKEKNLLVVYLNFPKDPAQSFPALILKYLARLGWSVTVVALEFGGKPKESWEDWSGIHVLRITPALNLISALSLRLYSRRSNDIKALRLRAASKGGEHARGSPYSGFSILRAAANSILNVFDDYYHLSRYVTRSLIKVHEKRPFSVVMSVYKGPFASYVVARQFAKESHLPCAALVKDWWGRVPTYPNVPSPILRIFVSLKYAVRRHMEAKVLRDADILLPHCQPVADYLEALVPGAKLRILPNCYDDEDFNEDLEPKVPAPDGIFTALCLGKPTARHRYDMFFDAIRELRTSGSVDKDIFRVKFVGAGQDLIRSYAEAYSCSDLVESLPEVSHKEAMFHLKQATCLLCPITDNSLGRRTPEYMAARKPILAFPWDDTSASQQYLEAYGGATFARNSHEIAATLVEWYRAFKAGNGIYAPIEEQVVQSFKASNRALELQDVLTDVLRTTE